MEWEIDNQVGYYDPEHQRMLELDAREREHARQACRDKPFELFATELAKVVAELYPHAKISFSGYQSGAETKPLSDIDIDSLDFLPYIQSHRKNAIILLMKDEQAAACEGIIVSKKAHEKPVVDTLITAANEQGINTSALVEAREGAKRAATAKRGLA